MWIETKLFLLLSSFMQRGNKGDYCMCKLLFSIKARSIATLPAGGDDRPSQRNPSILSEQFTGTHLYTWVERHTESKVSCLRTQQKDPQADQGLGRQTF